MSQGGGEEGKQEGPRIKILTSDFRVGNLISHQFAFISINYPRYKKERCVCVALARVLDEQIKSEKRIIGMSLLGVALTILSALVIYIVFNRLTTTHPYHDVPIPKRESWLLGNSTEREPGNVQAGAKLIAYAKQFQSDVFLLPEPVG